MSERFFHARFYVVIMRGQCPDLKQEPSHQGFLQIIQQVIDKCVEAIFGVIRLHENRFVVHVVSLFVVLDEFSKQRILCGKVILKIAQAYAGPCGDVAHGEIRITLESQDLAGRA